jgi:hypothetical protein
MTCPGIEGAIARSVPVVLPRPNLPLRLFWNPLAGPFYCEREDYFPKSTDCDNLVSEIVVFAV